MPFKLINAGGSLTFSAVVLAAVWAVRSITAAARHRRKAAANSSTQQGGQASKYAFTITPTALAWLVREQAVPYFVVDVRQAADVADDPLPDWLQDALHIPEPSLAAALSAPYTTFTSAAAATAARAAAADISAPEQVDAGHTDQPHSIITTSYHLLVLVGRDEQQQAAAAARVAAAGYDRVAVLSGGACSLRNQKPALQNLALPLQQQLLGRDALALLLDLVPLSEEQFQQLSDSLAQQQQQQKQQQQQQQPGSPLLESQWEPAAALDGPAGLASEAAAAAAPVLRGRRVFVLDVRRHDERTLYGAIPGALHLPVDELPSALQLPPGQFRHRYHFEPPAPADVLVLQSRHNVRAHWAGQLARDAGWKHVFIYVDGVRNWQFSLAVQSYLPYQQWQLPPDPEPFVPCQPDVAAGAAQLQRLGLLGLLLEQHEEHNSAMQQQQ